MRNTISIFDIYSYLYKGKRNGSIAVKMNKSLFTWYHKLLISIA